MLALTCRSRLDSSVDLTVGHLDGHQKRRGNRGKAFGTPRATIHPRNVDPRCIDSARRPRRKFHWSISSPRRSPWNPPRSTLSRVLFVDRQSREQQDSFAAVKREAPARRGKRARGRVGAVRRTRRVSTSYHSCLPRYPEGLFYQRSNELFESNVDYIQDILLIRE